MILVIEIEIYYNALLAMTMLCTLLVLAPMVSAARLEDRQQ